MRQATRIFLLAAALMLAGVAARADEGPPVSVRLTSELKPAVAGELYRGSVTIVAHAPVTMDNFQIEGRSWSEQQIQQAPIDAPAKGASYELSFSAIPNDPEQPLVIRFDVDGHTVTKTLDLSPRNVGRAFEPASTRAVAASLDLPYAPAPHRGLEPERVSPPQRKAPGIHVTGRFSYRRPDSVRDFARSMLVEIYDEDYDMDADDLLGSGYTDDLGNFDFVVNALNDDPLDVSDLKAVFKTINAKVDVRNPTTDRSYDFSSVIYYDFTGTQLDFGHLEPDDTADRPAMFLFNTAARAYVWCDQEGGYEMPPVEVFWPDGTNGAWYIPGTAEVHISTEHQWNDGTVGHEYGHYWEDTFSIKEPKTYCNPGGWCDVGGCGHCLWCNESEVVAWLEGWAQFFSMAFTQAYGGMFAIAPMEPRNFETLLECGIYGYHTPDLVEGFCAAMLQDIYDDDFENDPLYPDWADNAFLGIDEIMTVVELDNPYSPISFLDQFIARYPAYKEGIWQTAMNNGYDPDHAAPGNVSVLNSPSHGTGGDSADPTIDFTWAAAPDDASGIAGYGLYIADISGMPGAVLDIGPVTAYTTDPLPAGTYWFNIRAVDRAGNWSPSYMSYGPITIRTAEPVDLVWYDPANWPYPLVPSDVSTNSNSSCPIPASLPGNSAGSYWNLWGSNQGDEATASGFHVGLFVDGQTKAGISYGPIGGGSQYASTNRGPLTIRGGRHSFSVRHDDLNTLAEADETNNIWGRQFMWTGLPLAQNLVYDRVAPPPAQGGWGDVDDATQIKFYNCDGLSFSTDGYWLAAMAWADDNADDYHLKLYPRSTGPEDGYAVSLAYSSRGAGYLDAVLINTNTTGSNDYDLGVLNLYYGADSDYHALLVRESYHAIDDSVTYTMAADHYLRLFEFYVAAADTGHVSIVVDTNLAEGPFAVGWLNRDFTLGTLYDFSGISGMDASGRARIDAHITDPGYHCAVVYRNPVSGAPAQAFTLEIEPTRPEPQTLLASGWHSAIVPRPDTAATTGLVALPDTLHGSHAGPSYLNFASYNDSPTSADNLFLRLYTDGAHTALYSYPIYPAYSERRSINRGPFQIPGGRHTLEMRVDPFEEMEEIDETNNAYSEQYVWSPLILASGDYQLMPGPPDPFGGHASLPEFSPKLYNRSGLRISQGAVWQALATLPVAATDRVSIGLDNPAVGVQEGFDNLYGYSDWGAGQSDFVLVNYNQATGGDMDVGVLDSADQSGPYIAHSAGSTFLGSNPLGLHGPYAMSGSHIVALHEIYLSVAGVHSFRLENASGVLDWGISLYGPNAVYEAKSGSIPGAAAWLAPAGADEEFAVDLTTAGYYCLAVWKVGSSDLYEAGIYNLRIFKGATAVEYGPDLPSRNAFRSAHPNPFNPATTLSFDLARTEAVRLEIYDLQGRRVRTLVDEIREAGAHRVRWDGLDDSGRSVASNVYFARLRAGEFSQSRKLLLLK